MDIINQADGKVVLIVSAENLAEDIIKKLSDDSLNLSILGVEASLWALIHPVKRTIIYSKCIKRNIQATIN